MSLEENIKDCIQRELESGVVERAIQKKLESAIEESIKDLFQWNGAAKKAIEKALEETMVPVLEKYDYSKFVPKIDAVITNVLNNVTDDYREITKNLGKVLEKVDLPNPLRLSDIFDKWKEYVQKNIDKNSSKIDSCYVDINMTTNITKRDWSDYENCEIAFECPSDPRVNRQISIYKWYGSSLDKGDDMYYFRYEGPTITSMKHLDDFNLYLLKISQNNIIVELDEEEITDEIDINEEY